MVTQMIAVGEQTGAMDAMLQKIADFYEDEVDAAVKDLPDRSGTHHDRLPRHRGRRCGHFHVPAAVHVDRQTGLGALSGVLLRKRRTGGSPLSSFFCLR